MDFQVRISDPALADFEGILEYSWVNFPATAESFGNALLNHIGLLRTFPYIGCPVAGRPGIRQLVHTPILKAAAGSLVDTSPARPASRSAMADDIWPDCPVYVADDGNPTRWFTNCTLGTPSTNASRFTAA